MEDERPGSRSGNPSLAVRLLQLAWQYRWGCLKILLLQLVILTIGLSGLGFAGLGIDYIRHEVQPESRAPHWPFGMTPPGDWSPMMVVTLISGMILAMAIVRSVLNYFHAVWVADLVQARIVVDLRAKVYNRLQRLSFRFFDDNVSGSIINRVTRDVQATRLFIDGVVIQGIIMVLSLAVYVAYMVSIHPGLTMVCLMTTPLLWALSVWFSKAVRPAYARSRLLFDDLIMALSESVQGMHVIKGFAREKERLEKFAEANAKVRDQSMWTFKRIATFSPSIGLLTQMNLVLLLAYGGMLVIRQELSLGTGMVVFAGLLQQFSGQVANLANLTNHIQESLTGARRVFEVLDTPVEIVSSRDAKRIPYVKGRVTFENVSFGHEPDTMVLRDVNMDVHPGQCVAILGATGAGKSTLMSLIPRFYDPVKGRVLIDGVDARDLDVDDLRRRVGIVFQESFLFSNTIAANIAFGCPDATMDRIERAARIASAHDFIAALPDGYATVIGEGGCDLSGGQRQRLAIARAVMLEPSILLLDDPTAAIDPKTEHEIMDGMENAMRGRTTFVVAHRLSTLRKADMIVVLERGKVVQCGTHDDLMKVGGPYRGVVMMQVMDDESQRALEEAEAE